MAVFTIHHPWAFIFGLLDWLPRTVLDNNGNIISFMVYLAPLPTFYRIYRNKSTEGFQSVPYVVALFSAMLWIYYACLKTEASLLITINTVGCVIESAYIAMYIIYAPRKAKILTAKMLMLLNVGVFGLILLLTFFLASGSNRVRILGWVCVGFSVSVFAAPLSIMRLVIRTKSVEFMPFSLSFFLTLSAIMWFCYGFLIRDFYIALPNILGFIFGVLQMILYVIYKDNKKKKMVLEEGHRLPEQLRDVIKSDGAVVNISEGFALDDIQVKQCSDKDDNPDHRAHVNEQSPTQGPPNNDINNNEGQQAQVQSHGCQV